MKAENARLDRWMAREGELLIEIDRLRTELVEIQTRRCERADAAYARTFKAEARLAAVIALCDKDELGYYGHASFNRRVRAVATGEGTG